MTTRHESGGVDAGLERLLAVEQRLEAELRAAEAAAQATIAAAHAEAAALTRADDPTLVEQQRREEADALAAHDRALQALAAERDAQLRRLEGIAPETLDVLAKRVVVRVLAPGQPRRAP